jgi:hypothetical protein
LVAADAFPPVSIANTFVKMLNQHDADYDLTRDAALAFIFGA